MDQIFLANNESFMAANLIRALTTPTLIPSIIYSVIGGILTIVIYDKYAKKGYFLPYIYFGTTALLYTFSHIFLVIFVEEERRNIESVIDQNVEKNVTSIMHENALYISLIISAVGSYFALLAILRLLEVWIRVGLQRNLHLSKYYLGVLTATLSAIPFVFAVCGSVIFIQESKKEEEEEDLIRLKKGLTLKLISASFYVVLILFYLIICLSYAWATYISNMVEKSVNQSEKNSISEEMIVLVERTFTKTFLMLLTLGLLSLTRFIYDVYVTALMIKFGPVWDADTNLILVVITGIILLIVTCVSDLPNVKVLVVLTKMNLKPQKQTRNIIDTEEVILLSRSPIHFDVER
ncbi:hypothetical protein BD770DRAFT_384243 [Pilaira anomala]|nr:hypothetical protein BD770DRAFT_384243 [Pilaira anomala]